MALLHKLRSVGIGGKLFNMIKGMYGAPKIAVRVGNEVSNPTEYLCGGLQGCPASPILFGFFINDIFKGVRGVQVPTANLNHNRTTICRRCRAIRRIISRPTSRTGYHKRIVRYLRNDCECL
ncbi:hypothetical protein AYI70_g373 [Smittium culicis]|uniref:Uncharacterized protein n=1 Tax=Smittium culicis TaxID=133412 RepID=A0A1R1YGY1_9FUNG|nr:hypothetical protein AYI70_g373 [Smittium culicis]